VVNTCTTLLNILEHFILAAERNVVLCASHQKDSLNWWNFVVDMKCVSCKERTEFLYNTKQNLSPYQPNAWGITELPCRCEK
jgi:hypothetical protein